MLLGFVMAENGEEEVVFYVVIVVVARFAGEEGVRAGLECVREKACAGAAAEGDFLDGFAGEGRVLEMAELEDVFDAMEEADFVFGRNELADGACSTCAVRLEEPDVLEADFFGEIKIDAARRVVEVGVG